MTSILVLAARLRAMNDHELRAVLDAREPAPDKIHDFFDLAEALLDRRSIQSALSALDRHTLAALASPTDTGEPAGGIRRAQDLLLVQHDAAGYTPYDAVAEQLAAWPSLGLPGATELTEPAPAPAPGAAHGPDAAADLLAAERAFGTVSAVAELVAELGRQPAHELQKGGIALPDRKRLADAMSVDLEHAEAILSIAERAGLVVAQSGYRLAAESAQQWSMHPTPERWSALAGGWLGDVPDGIRDVLASPSPASWGHELHDYLLWLYPAGGESLEQLVSALVRDAEALGISTHHDPRTAGRALLDWGPDAAAAVLADHFPHEVDQVYLQHDLSVVSPGALSPAIDSRLRRMADVETRAQASSYRLSAASLNRAIAGGESAARILEFLAGISLSGIPQPVEYLIAETAARYGLLRVAAATDADADAARGRVRSRLHSSDTALIRTLEVDQSLASLGLRRIDEHTLVSRFERDMVFWALTDSRYPAAAEDSAGTIMSLTRHPVAPAAAGRKADPVGELITRLRDGQSTGSEETSAAWLARQLEIAVRGRVALVVTVALQNDKVVDYLLEPTGIGGGRLRGRDRRSDIERTLPLSHIRSAVPAVD